MPLSINGLKPDKNSTKKRKRIGRGNSSGHGTYSTRGLKGQNSRSGASGLKLKGMKTILRAIPKKRGFKSMHPKAQVVSLALINKHFKDSDIVSIKSLILKNLVQATNAPVKILSNGILLRKNLKFSGVGFSENAKIQAEKLGAKID